MTEPNRAPSTHRLLVGVFLAALLTHAWWVTRNWTTPYMQGHEFRQAQTALNSYYIDRENNFSLLYETPLVGKPWVSILMEVPIYEWAVVGLSRWWDVPHYVAARTISLACFYLTLPALYLLLGRLAWSPPRRLFALAFVLVCPVYIFYSRAFLMDSMAFMGCAWFLYGFLELMDRRRWPWFVLAAFAGTVAALVKSATLAIWLWPAAAYGAWRLWRSLRPWTGWGEPLQTVFWGLAGVSVPLGALRLWIDLTDPIKAVHSSAWIFTSKNLSQGNWGLTDLAARFSPGVWKILAERWSEAVMPPALLLLLVVAGAVALPRVRWPALGLAAVFFWAQLLFPYAYAYQDYYFYSCAVFLCLGLGGFALGALDTRWPRWLAWLLVAVPLVAQFATYYRGYRPYQLVQSQGGSPITRAIRDFLPKESVIVVAGGDWSAIIPFNAQRRALMIRNGLENDAVYLNRAFGELFDEDVAALVLVGGQRGNHALIERAARAFDTDVVPTFSSGDTEVYCNVRYRDRLKEDLRNAGNYDGLTNEVRPASTVPPAQTFAVAAPAGPGLFPGFSPAPIRAHFELGLGYIWVDGRKVTFMHPEADVWFRAPAGMTELVWAFGIIDQAFARERDHTDGVEFTVTSVSPLGTREIFRRFLDPASRPEDRGLQQVTLAYRPVPGEFLRFSTRPGLGRAFDWAYSARIELK